MAASNPLEVVLRTGNFPQTGSWNMLDLTKMAVQWPVGILQRCAASRVESTTLAVAVAMGATFQLSSQGRRNLDEAQSKLHALGTINSTLWIGFGVEDLTRVMARSEGGAAMLGLCAALQECYAQDLAVEVLLEYAQMTKAEASSMPSYAEFRALLDACAGTLAASPFPLRAERLMVLAGQDVRPKEANMPGLAIPGISHRRQFAVPQSMAAAIKALADVSCAKLEATIISGGSNIGWLAALADWLFGLKITVVVDSTGDALYCNHDTAGDYQVQFRSTAASYGPRTEQPATRDRDVEDHDEQRSVPLWAETTQASDIVHVKSRTHRMTLDQAELMLGEAERYMVVSGRLEWKSILEETFTLDFHRLMMSEEHLGELLGCAARISQGRAMAEGDVAQQFLRDWGYYCEASYGMGFVTSVADRFPELHDRPVVWKFMREGVRKGLAEAEERFKACDEALSSMCRCDDCMNVDTLSDEQPSRSYCLPLIARTVMYLVKALSNTELAAETILPTRHGIELAYEHIKRCTPRGRVSHPLAHVDAIQEAGGHISAALEIFSGRAVRDQTDWGWDSSAVWANGLTAFLWLLKDSAGETREEVGNVHIVPGRIRFEGQSFKSLKDRQDAIKGLSFTNPGTTKPSTNLGYIWRTVKEQPALDHRALLVETSHSNRLELRCALSLSNVARIERAIAAGPCYLADVLTICRGQVFCPFNSLDSCRQPLHPDVSLVAEEVRCSEYVVKDDTEKRVFFVSSTSSNDALALIASAVKSGLEERMYIIDSECRSCCTDLIRRLAIAGNDPQVYLFIRTPA